MFVSSGFDKHIILSGSWYLHDKRTRTVYNEIIYAQHIITWHNDRCAYLYKCITGRNCFDAMLHRTYEWKKNVRISRRSPKAKNKNKTSNRARSDSVTSDITEEFVKNKVFSRSDNKSAAPRVTPIAGHGRAIANGDIISCIRKRF